MIRLNSINEKQLRSIIEVMNDGIVILNAEKRILFLNPAAERLLTKRAQGLLDTIFELPENSRDAVEIEVPSTGEAKTVVEARVSKTEWDGEVVSVLSLRDVTERKWSENASHRSQEYFRLLIDNSSDIITILNQNGTIRYNSPSFYRSFGYSLEELLGKPVLDFVHPEDQARLREISENFKETASLSLEYRFRHKNGSWRVMESIGSDLLAHPLIFGIVLNSRDITERTRLEQLKDEFVQTVSHELRTPMTIIREGISQVLDELHGPTTEKQRKFLSAAIRNMDRLGHIIDSLLDVSKLEAKKMELQRERVDLVELTREVLFSFHAPVTERGLSLIEDLPPHEVFVWIDRDKIIQVIMNLVKNAMKFTEKGEIRIWITQKKDEVAWSIEDTGVGISEVDMPKVFKKFQQFGRTHGPGEKGTGLGLAISKGIIELHQGHIEVESRGKGTKFTFTLQKEAPEAAHGK